ncbi:hypothetical protein JCM8097_004329 [Rhodosporidiobolus ruineniae]
MKSVLALALLASTALASSHDSHDRQALHRRAASKQAGWVRRNKPYLVAPNATESTTAASATAPASSAVVVNPTYNGTALWFYESGSTGACLKVNTDDDLVVGLPDTLWADSGVVSDYCGQQVTLINTDNNKTVTATVADASGKEYITLTRAAFLQLSPLSVGMIPVQYQFVNGTTLSNATATASAVVSGSVAVAPSAPVASSAASGVFNQSAEVKVAAVPVATTAAPVTTAAVVPTTTVDSVSILAASKAAAQAAASQEAAEAAQSSKVAAAAAASKQAALDAASSSSAAAAASSSRAAAAYQSQQAVVLAAKQEAAAEAAASSQAAAAALPAASSQAAAAAASSKAAAAAASSQAAAEAAASSSAAAAAAASQKAAASSGSSKVYSGGIATFFYQNGVAGNCGKVNADSTLLVALPTVTYAGGSHCGQTVTIKRLDTGNTISALVADSCPTCDNNNCLDLSTGAFKALGGTDAMGVFDIEWWFN